MHMLTEYTPIVNGFIISFFFVFIYSDRINSLKLQFREKTNIFILRMTEGHGTNGIKKKKIKNPRSNNRLLQFNKNGSQGGVSSIFFFIFILELA